MVSTSRKKNKGRDRKAKKAEAERARVRDKWLMWATGEDKVTREKIQCDHGRRVTIPDLDHPVSKFMNDFSTYRSADNADFSTVKMMRDILQTNPQVCNNNGCREMVVSILTSMGTNLLLMQIGDKELEFLAIRIAKTLHVLENHDGGGSLEVVLHSQKVSMKRRDFGSPTGSSRRDALKFFSKRVSCSCLKVMHQIARETMPKTGICICCEKEKERVALSVCSRCMIMQYCSRKCQVTDWPTHEGECDMYVRAHKQQTQADENEKDK